MSLDLATSTRRAQWLVEHLGGADLVPLPIAEAEELAMAMDEWQVGAGDRVFTTGELPERVHVLRRGAIELSPASGRRAASLAVLRPGDIFGDVPLLLRRPEPFDAVALEDSSVLSIDSMALFSLLVRRPQLARRWMVSIAERLAAMQMRVEELLAGSLDEQVASFVLREARRGDITYSQETIARLLGARRTSVNQSLQRLAQRGLLRIGYRRVTVLDERGLGAVARSGLV